nr:SpoIIE family protein phosphatase [Nocardioides pocheonensis]
MLVDDPEALYERAPCGYLSIDAAGLVVKANATFLTWTGHESRDVVGQVRFIDLLAAGSKLFHETHFRPLLLLDGQVSEVALELLRHDGSRLPVLVNAVLDRAEDGAPGITRVAVFDATERRRYERELLAAKKRAEDAEKRMTLLARTLQETLMPPRNPWIDGLDIATAYRPAGTGDEIGGDFYDVFAVSASDWVVTIGDVAGKGVEAAAVATLVRHTIRALAISETSPATILSQLNQVVLDHPSERFCTAAVLRLRRIGDWWDVAMAAGGHPPAIVLDTDKVPRVVGEPGHLVGAFPSVAYEDIRFELRPGTTVLLYTDGVTDGRRGSELYGEERLMRLLHESVDTAEPLIGRVLDDVLAFQGQEPRDDIALVALQVPPLPD